VGSGSGFSSRGQSTHIKYSPASPAIASDFVKQLMDILDVRSHAFNDSVAYHCGARNLQARGEFTKVTEESIRFRQPGEKGFSSAGGWQLGSYRA
jgi:hypothetical protein